jgi:hypothetical protein
MDDLPLDLIPDSIGRNLLFIGPTQSKERVQR